MDDDLTQTYCQNLGATYGCRIGHYGGNDGDWTCRNDFCGGDKADISVEQLEVWHHEPEAPPPQQSFPGSALISEENAGQINAWIAEDTATDADPNQEWVRCYQKSADSANSRATFHAQCDGKGPTVTVAKIVTTDGATEKSVRTESLRTRWRSRFRCGCGPSC